MNPKISVIVPVYNVAEYIEECIQSLAVQTFKDFEVIFVDDRGKDDSIHIIEHELGRIKANSCEARIIKHERNRGLSAARNTGFEAAKGDYIYFLDSDDYISSDCLEKLCRAAIESNAEVTIGNYEVIGGSSYGLPHLYTDKCENPLQGYLSGSYYVMAWNKLCKKSFLQENNLYFIEGLVHEDEPWTFSMACCAKKIALVKDNTYVYRVRENSLQTGKDFSKHFNAYLTILRTIRDIISENDLSNKCSWWFERRKALLFGQTLFNGTLRQQKEIYKVIRECLPNGGFSKTRIHYWLPQCIGICVYRKFHRYYLC